MSAFYTALGLGLDIVGAWCLAYELLLGLPKRNRREIVDKRLENLRGFVALLIGDLAPPSPPYSEEEVARDRQRVLDEWQPRIEALEAEIAKLGHGHEEKAFVIGWLGVCLLTLGFGLQIYAVLG